MTANRTLRPFARLGLLCSLLAACGGGERPRDRAFSSTVDHAYFPLLPGAFLSYEGEKDGQGVREEIATLDWTRRIMGVECTGLQEQVFVEDVLTELTLEWYAQDDSGNVWKFGEESYERDGEDLVLTPDSWLAGKGDAMPHVAMPAQPRPGDVWTGAHEDTFAVVSVTASATVPAGTFGNCLELVENPDDPEDQDIILYAPGIGRVVERGSSSVVWLTAVGRH